MGKSSESSRASRSNTVLVCFFILSVLYPLSMGPAWLFIDHAHPYLPQLQYLAIPYIPLMLIVEDTTAEVVMRRYIELWTGTPVGPLTLVRW